MAKYTTLNGLFTAIANSIRNKTGESGKIVADDFPDMIDGISGLTITDDGEGNVTITANGSVSITDDENGNVVIA